jgi:hypothetical protein
VSEERTLTDDEGDTALGRRMGFLEMLVCFVFIKPASRMFSRVLSRAYERSFISSTQYHELHAIWDRMYRGE